MYMLGRLIWIWTAVPDSGGRLGLPQNGIGRVLSWTMIRLSWMVINYSCFRALPFGLRDVLHLSSLPITLNNSVNVNAPRQRRSHNIHGYAEQSQ
jgi:hypothetical protein